MKFQGNRYYLLEAKNKGQNCMKIKNYLPYNNREISAAFSKIIQKTRFTHPAKME